ncbi:MAG: hypothetical protein ABIH71_03040 [Candidatus Omnitrophota bacterium]|nr:hypothetical protein [Candidatus Omnitrophota bacterium]
MKQVVICDANILIDYANAEKQIIELATRYLYDIWVPLPVWEEIADFSKDDVDDLGIHIIEPSLEQLIEAATIRGGGLSDEDNMCFIMARDETAICATNEKALRRKCEKNNIRILWGLEIMVQLCKEDKLRAKVAERVARKIAQNNITITEAIVANFIKLMY